jgi:ligand-binding SRPBCC domain-containing protein
MIRQLYREQTVGGDLSRVWDFFSSPRNLAAITPAHLRFEIQSELPARMFPGQMISYRIGILPGITTRWLTEITHVREGEFFVDEQRLGPYRLWHHEHHFTPTADRRGVRMIDRVTYDVGWGPLGDALHALWIGQQLETIFNYRARKVAELFPDHAAVH